MAVVSKVDESKVHSNFFKSILKNTVVEKVKKLAIPILVAIGLLSAEISIGVFFNISMPILTAVVLTTSAAAFVAFAVIFKIKRSKNAFSQTCKTYDLKEILANEINFSKKKRLCYEELTKDDPIDEKVVFTKAKIENKGKIKKESLLKNSKMKISSRDGTFKYDETTDEIEHWTANFADENLFGYAAHTNLLAQDELQVLEHPALYHLRVALSKDSEDLKSLKSDEIALIKGVKRKGVLKNIYGGDFEKKSEWQIKRNLTKIKDPHESNIFAIVAPKADPRKANKPYEKDDLEKLFYRSYLAFASIKQQAKGKKVAIHTGNWGAGAFGGSVKAAVLCQLAACKKANIDECIFYPIDKKQDFEEAKDLFETIERKYPNMKVDEFLTHIAKNAKRYDLLYGVSNNT